MATVGRDTARCQHCPCLADERSFMCSDCAAEADFEVQTLRDQLERIALLAAWIDRDWFEPDKVRAYTSEITTLAAAGVVSPRTDLTNTNEET